MRNNLEGKDWKSVDGLVVVTDTLEVYNANGTMIGKLPPGDFPCSREGILSLLQKPKAKPEKKVEESVVKKGLSLHSLKNPPKPGGTFKKKTIKIKKKRR